jgi:hypothetical protein
VRGELYGALREGEPLRFVALVKFDVSFSYSRVAMGERLVASSVKIEGFFAADLKMQADLVGSAGCSATCPMPGSRVTKADMATFKKKPLDSAADYEQNHARYDARAEPSTYGSIKNPPLCWIDGRRLSCDQVHVLMGLWDDIHKFMVKHLGGVSLGETDVETADSLDRMQAEVASLEATLDEYALAIMREIDLKARVDGLCEQEKASATGRRARRGRKAGPAGQGFEAEAALTVAVGNIASVAEFPQYLKRRSKEVDASVEMLRDEQLMAEQEKARIEGLAKTLEATWADAQPPIVKELMRVLRALGIQALEFGGAAWNGNASWKILKKFEVVAEKLREWHEGTETQKGLRAAVASAKAAREGGRHVRGESEDERRDRERADSVDGVLRAAQDMATAVRGLLKLALKARELTREEAEADIPRLAAEVQRAFQDSGVVGARGVWPKLYTAVVEFARFALLWGTIGLISEAGIEVYHKFDNQVEAACKNMGNIEARDKAKINRLRARQNVLCVGEKAAHTARRSRVKKEDDEE